MQVTCPRHGQKSIHHGAGGAILVLFKQVPEKGILRHHVLLSLEGSPTDNVASLEKGNVLLRGVTVSCSCALENEFYSSL